MDKLKAVRKKLLEDFAFYAEHALKVRSKEGEIVPLKLKPAQKILLDLVLKDIQTRGYVRIVILKARQQGLSTVVEALLYWITSQRTGRKGIVIAHDAEATQTLFGMCKRYYDNCPEVLRPHTKYANKNELFFDVLDSQITVATAGGRGVGRSQSNTFIHASEMAFWPIGSAGEIWNGLRQTVADKPGTYIFLESTANGLAGPYAEVWRGANLPDGHKDRNEYTPCFIPWFLDPDYSAPAPPGFDRSPEEEELVARYDLTDDQLFWRRQKINEGGREKFKQEFPATAQEAFLTSGRPVFDAEIVTSRLDEVKHAPKPPTFSLSPTEKWEPDRRGELRVFEEPKSGCSYVIGADVGKGIKGCDYSVAQVLDANRNQVAVWQGIVAPDYFAKVLQCLGEKYHLAELIVENNDHGILTCYKLAKEHNYPFLYQTTRYDTLTDEESQVAGFTTNARTKPLIIDQLREAIRKGLVVINDTVTLTELQSYIVTEKGKLQAEEGCHDDAVMSLALANHRALDLPAPVPMDDSWYRESF